MERPSDALVVVIFTGGVGVRPGARGAEIRGAAWPMASVATGAASACSCFRHGLVVEREVAQHGALAAVVGEVGHGLVVVFPDGGHNGHDLSADAAAAGQAGAPHSLLADRHGESCLFMMLGNSCTGATERPSDGPVADLLTGGFGACPGRCGGETPCTVGAMALRWKHPPLEDGRCLPQAAPDPPEAVFWSEAC